MATATATETRSAQGERRLLDEEIISVGKG